MRRSRCRWSTTLKRKGNESFSLLLSDPVGATLVDASAAVAVGCETFAVPHRRGRAGHRAL